MRSRISDLAFEFGLSDHDVAELTRELGLPEETGASHLLAPGEFVEVRESLLHQRRFWGRRFRSRHPVVIDAANAAYTVAAASAKPSLGNIIVLRKALERHLFVHRRDPAQRLAGARVWTVADASLQQRIDDRDGYLAQVHAGEIEEAPPGMHADGFFLPRAEECCAYVVSNDEFSDYRKWYPRTLSRLIRFSIHDGQVKLEMP